MHWKSWPYWVKGGVTFVLAGVLLLTALNQLPRNSESGMMKIVGNGATIVQVLLSLPAIPLAFLGDTGKPSPVWLSVEIYAVLALYWFGLGAFLGNTYGKYKNRNLTGSPPTRG